FVRDGRPEQPRPDDVGGGLLFFVSDFCELGRRNVHIAYAAIGEDGHGDVVPGLGVERERAGAENLDVVRVCSDGEDVHGKSGLVDRWMDGFLDGWIYEGVGGESRQPPVPRLASIDVISARSLFTSKKSIPRCQTSSFM